MYIKVFNARILELQRIYLNFMQTEITKWKVTDHFLIKFAVKIDKKLDIKTYKLNLIALQKTFYVFFWHKSLNGLN